MQFPCATLKYSSGVESNMGKSASACGECDSHVKPENVPEHMRRVHPNVKYAPPRGVARPRAPSRPFPTRTAAFVAIVVLVIAGAGWMLSRNLQSPADPSAVQVRISMAGWSPATLETTIGRPLKVDVVAGDDAHGAGHDFRIDGLGIDEYVGSTQKVFTLPADQPGTYQFYCSLCCGGKDSPTMVGTYTVKGG